MKDKSIIGAFSSSLGLIDSKRIMKLEIYGQTGQIEVRYLIKIRIEQSDTRTSTFSAEGYLKLCMAHVLYVEQVSRKIFSTYSWIVESILRSEKRF
ncbi:hypothetical protein NUSPORA_01926 [Nucleospora cyclopteri]